MAGRENCFSASRTLRRMLLGTVGGVCLTAVAGGALAQTTEGEVAPQGGLVSWGGVAREPQIVIADPGTPATAQDPEDVTGIGQMIIDQQNGFIGLCTATLINPRTVIFAAHCVNERPAADYGAATGGTPIGFGFSSNNNAAGNSAFGQWLFGGHQTDTAGYMYNANHVAYHPASLEPGANSFLYGDVAMASLDTAAGDIPTWSMLFSQLPAPAITANGTGYHVDLAGYGRNGTGTTGSTGSDYRRRLAENMLGALASLDDFEGFLFGGSSGLPQNLYWIDFDDPRRGTAQASPFDFNAWRDNPLPREGITASGDSGGPLILDETFDRPVVIGVLSGGYTRFFNGQPANGYGTASFFQPLYLYWDWIAANNPYHYVSALAGDGDWTDASHWVTTLDPNYQVIGAGGQLANGVPVDPGEGPGGTDGAFGQACFESGGVSQCQDMATGEFTVEVKPIGTGATNGADVASVESLSGFDLDDGAVAQAGPAAGVGVAALPSATLLNGLPGASNFTPDNSDGDRLNDIPPRYFDVTLSANGTTTLGTAATIDRLTIAGAGAGLDITASGSLYSHIDITQLIGTLNVDGSLETPGDFFMMAGGLSGTGTITAPFFTNMAGVIAPGTPTSIGTLNFDGEVILASGGSLLINLGANGTSDQVAVTGHANVGGLVAFSYAPTAAPAYGDIYTFLTAQGGVSGAFTAAPISAILTPELTYGATSVQVEIAAGLYADVVTDSPIQAAYAQLLDQNRVQYDEFADLYGPLDLGDAASIQANLEALAPRAETLKTALGTAAVNSMARFYRGRLSSISADDFDGSIEVIGRPVDYASAARDSLDGGSISPLGDSGESRIVPGSLPDNMRGYIAAGYLDGRSAPMSTVAGASDDRFDGYFIATGVEAALDRHQVIGAALSTSDLSGETAGLPQSADGQLWQVAIYGRRQSDNGLILDGQLSVGRFDVETQRLAMVGASVFTLRTEDEADVLAGEIGVGYRTVREEVSITPEASLRASRISYGPTVETGGGPALAYQREDSKSLEGRIGLSVAGLSPTFRPWVTAHYVHAFEDQPAAFGANFVGGVGPDVLFALANDDPDWGEIGVGFEAVRDSWRATVGAETTVGRSDLVNRSLRAEVAFRF